MKSVSLLFSLFIVFGLLFPSDAFACACCADAGYYSISTRKPQKLELDELRRIRFADAGLFTTAGEDTILGINPVGESYTLNGLMQSSQWKFNFKDNTGKSGALNLTAPLSMVDYAVDIHDAPEGGTGEPVLYKEWRFKYKVASGSGIFQKGVAPATEYFLVLQGRGNVCTQAENFTNWRLEVTGKKAGYAFFGKLASPAPAAN
jgi:hypothetical protein